LAAFRALGRGFVRAKAPLRRWVNTQPGMTETSLKLKLKLKRRAMAAARSRTHAWAASDSRVLRLARRWVGVLVDLKIQRGAGASAAAMLLLASTCYGVLKGGHAPVIAAQIQDICDNAANSAGFRISEIALAGEHEVSREDILSLAGITGRSSLLFLDAGQARTRLMTNPWIAQAAVLKLYPGRLRIEIKERQAFALWQKEGRVYLIATDGTVLETYVPQRFAALPLVVGNGAEHAARDFFDLLKRYPAIAATVEASVLVAERRWNLHLKGGLEVLLPEREPEHALRTLVELDRDKKLQSRDIVAVDLRLADRVTVRQSDAAATARDDALKAAAEKDKKAKRKGTDA
jgi:cell division protein FtsQ